MLIKFGASLGKCLKVMQHLTLFSERIIGMKPLKKCYKKLMADTERWCYYDADVPKLSFKMLNCKDKSYEFIKKYFKRGGKNAMLDFKQLDKYTKKIKSRAPYIISEFLLGILIEEAFNIDLNRRKDNICFKHLLFLACLYHNIGYAYKEEQKCEDLRTLWLIQEIGDIEYSRRHIYSEQSECENNRETHIRRNKEFAFILALADSIEPLKHTQNKQEFDEIEFEPAKGNGFILSVPEKCGEIYKAVKELPKWVDVNVRSCGDREFRITEKESDAELVNEYMRILRKICGPDGNNNF